MDADDLALFERSIRSAAERAADAPFDGALDELGVYDALYVDERAAIETLFSIQGAEHVTSDALSRVLGHAIDPEAPAALLLPMPGAIAPPGELTDDLIRVAGLARAALLDAGSVTLVARGADGDVLVSVAADDLTARTVDGMDPELGLIEVTGTVVVDTSTSTVADWERAVTLGRLAVAHELLGASRRMLDLAREHALGRVQFGRPIAQFQAIRHRLAETYVAIETAEAIIDAAWIDGTARTAAMAKALTGRTARTAARHCQQVLAGIGFTTEHPLHLYVRRIFVLDEMFGSARVLSRRLGAEVIEERTLPPLLPL